MGTATASRTAAATKSAPSQRDPPTPTRVLFDMMRTPRCRRPAPLYRVAVRAALISPTGWRRYRLDSAERTVVVLASNLKPSAAFVGEQQLAPAVAVPIQCARAPAGVFGDKVTLIGWGFSLYYSSWCPGAGCGLRTWRRQHACNAALDRARVRRGSVGCGARGGDAASIAFCRPAGRLEARETTALGEVVWNVLCSVRHSPGLINREERPVFKTFAPLVLGLLHCGVQHRPYPPSGRPPPGGVRFGGPPPGA